MGFLEKFINKGEKLINSKQYAFEVKQKAQIELIQKAGGDDFAGTWIDANGRRFDELVNDPRYDFIERLPHKNTHTTGLPEKNKKAYA